MDIQYKCLSIIDKMIKFNYKYKEIVCNNDGIKLLLDIIIDKTNINNDDLLYSLFDIMKQLCIRNDKYKGCIHELIIKYIQKSFENQAAIKTLLKVLQSTLSFDDDIRFMLNKAKYSKPNILIVDEENNEKNNDETQSQSLSEKDEDRNILNKENLNQILQLLRLQNHQIRYELQMLCQIILRSRDGQIILIQSLIEMINGSKNETKRENNEFIRNVINQSMEMLTPDTKLLLRNSDLNVL